MQTQWSCVYAFLGLDLSWRGRNFPSYRGSPGQPAVSAHFAERNGASARMLYPNGITHLQHDHSSIHVSHVVQEWLSRQADDEILDWTPRGPDTNPIESEVNRTMQETVPSSLLQIAMSYGPVCQTDGMKLLHLRVTFDHWLSPWHDEWKRWSKQKGSGLIIKAVNFWKQPF